MHANTLIQKRMIKFTPQFLKKLEDIFTENGYKVRFERGNFKSGFCILEDKKVVVVNKFAAIESRISTMIEILKLIHASQGLQGEKFEELNKLLLKQQSLEETNG